MSSIPGMLSHIRRRRAALQRELPIWQRFAEWEETCIPSYCHSNLAAAYISWRRLFTAVDMVQAVGLAAGPVLDFGSSTGELGRLMPQTIDYHFIEQEEAPARYLQASLPAAVRHTLGTARDGVYGAVFALDSLEHNSNYAELMSLLCDKLRPGGLFVLSGPTENFLYKLGRRIAGYDAHYHVSNILHIEAAAPRELRRVARRRVPFGVPLFSVSVWAKTS